MVEEILGLVRAQAAEVSFRPNRMLQQALRTVYETGDEELKGFSEFAGRRRAKLGTLAEIEGEYISEILAVTKGNKAEAARMLGISRKSLYERIARFPHLGEPGTAETNGEISTEDELEDNLTDENLNP
ncbi:MAG: helix-turn-helix domain-containing protein [Pyrinomonadaceae bacterium]